MIAKTNFEGFGSIAGLFRFFIKDGFYFFVYFGTISWEDETKSFFFLPSNFQKGTTLSFVEVLLIFCVQDKLLHYFFRQNYMIVQKIASFLCSLFTSFQVPLGKIGYASLVVIYVVQI